MLAPTASLHSSLVQVQGKNRELVAETAHKLGLDGSYIPRSYIEQVLLCACACGACLARYATSILQGPSSIIIVCHGCLNSNHPAPSSPRYIVAAYGLGCLPLEASAAPASTARSCFFGSSSICRGSLYLLLTHDMPDMHLQSLLAMQVQLQQLTSKS